MAGESTSPTPKRSSRDGWWRGFLVLLLVPLAVASVCLARLPGQMTAIGISEDDAFVLTGNHLPFDDEGTEFRLLSVLTGQMKRLHASSGAEFSHGNLHWSEQHSNRIHVKCLDLTSFQETELGSFDATPFELGPCCFIQPGIVAMVNKRNEVCAVDLRTGTITAKSLPPLRTTQTHFWFALWRESPQRLLVVEVSNGATKGRDRMLLYSYGDGDGKLDKLAEWTANMIPRVADGNLLSLTIDHSLEIRRMSDGVLVETQPLAAALNLPIPAPAWPWPSSVRVTDVESELVGVAVRPNQQMVYDYLRRQVVWQRTSPNSRCQDLRQDAAVFIQDQAVEIWRFEDQSLLRRIEFALPVYDARFTHDGERVLVLLKDESVHVYDVASGGRIQTHRSRGWVRPTFVALLLGFAVWSWMWVRHSLRSELHPLWDVVVLNALVLAGLLLRAFLQGSLRDPDRLIYSYFEALGASWLLMLGLWFVFGRRRWSVKIIAPLLGLVGTVGLALCVFRGDQQPTWELVVGALGLTVTLIAIFGLARRWGWRMINAGVQPDQPRAHNVEARIPLRDMFLVIAAVGALFAVLRFVPASRFEIQMAGRLALLVVTTAVVAIGGAWAALSPRHWLPRIIVLIFLIAGAGSIHSALFPQLYNWQAWMWHLRFAALVTGLTCASLLTYRVRGWRFARQAYVAQYSHL